MNGCENAKTHLYEFIDRELIWRHRVRIKWHLRRCDPCSGAYGFENHLKQVIRARGGNDPLPPELMDRLRAFLHQHDADGPGL